MTRYADLPKGKPIANGSQLTRDISAPKQLSYLRGNTVETFGPVRSVKPELVFELAFENIQLSKRHKSGVAVRFPRIVRWRHDKPAAEADRLDHLKSMMSR